ncbi:hypothetical protein A2Y83_01205 [Candidatus Falkowbacteria bacterium RBG_13_39_14]|uniref:Polymerase beta nucleotidyltransferase domain-containing protein n=1 Tax=Candidatus Falkowbacteria bacterium RBG_13_39_14 TaxID=1797985 RepID=A0A1F5S4V3_9BACT|nr:MAG: hypothetical protein A2Y83_01205 [Candidatus Falkowbacteria bacterium RBG_13_39_14]
MEKKTKELTEKIIKEYSPEKIILFGSYAWGKPHKWSDIDLFIIKRSKKRRIERERDLRMKLFPAGVPLDILIYTPQEVKKRLDMEDFFINDIITKGKILYGK